ncbi:hypothetical protein TNCV_5092521 [Trichonephila clavipes]|nr:hypothetical protein TNCV_5092521 [Trichonephila clavipes]
MPKKGKGRGRGNVKPLDENKADSTVGRDDFPKLETTTSRSSKLASIPGSSSDCNSKSHLSFQGKDDFPKLETTISQSSKPAASSDCNSKSHISSQGTFFLYLLSASGVTENIWGPLQSQVLGPYIEFYKE